MASDADLQQASAQLRGGVTGLITGLSGSARHLYYAAVHTLNRQRNPGAATLIITHAVGEAEQVCADLQEFLPDEEVLLLPERELALAEVVAYSRDTMGQRVRALGNLGTGKGGVVVATIHSALQPVMKRALFQQAVRRYEVGAELDLTAEIEALVRAGYERVDLVENWGQFSVRGGILDIYPVGAQHPLRMELFDTELDSIRTFDVESQRSLEKLQRASVGPAFDFLLPPSRMEAVATELEVQLEQRLRTVTDIEVKERLQSIVGSDARRFAARLPFFGQLRYTGLVQDAADTTLDYLPQGSLVFLDEPARLLERQRGVERETREWISGALMRGEVLGGAVGEVPFHRLWEDRAHGVVEWTMFARSSGGRRHAFALNVTAKSMQQFHGQMNVLKTEVQRWRHSQTRVFMLAATEERRDRLERILADYRIEVTRGPVTDPPGVPVVAVGSITAGFELPLLRLAVVLDTEIFSAQKKSRRVRAEMSDAERIRSYQELNPGDYVVHVNHGIGKYLGIRTLEVDGKHKDYLHLQYAGADSLYVPVEQIDQVQRYVGADDKEPKVHHLGGSEWNRTKQKVSKSVRDIAEDLVKLYAARQATPGHAFSEDTPWQKDFEAMFPYEETPDQLRCIQEIKMDMEQSRPMDRLLCGDVGYGKTEVALRAAFKAVMDGKQVAVLVPTTILAHQHYETFKERFAGFPVTVEVLSRFRSRKESTAVIKGLKDGSIDVVIGTHRLLNKSVTFKDLGLLIVDEEQRFGVTHKERIKQLRTNVDCLTLTATPIPRTLHMSLLGVRDLSVIETPPENRFPVQTYVVEMNESLIREAIERELGRGGQVYFLYNQVAGIRSMADRVAKLVPEARVAVAHGQMAEDELERVMLDFLEGETDVLVTTTIIETGLDIPNVNTLIVCDADRLGLAQLYQLRGRVGRSNRIAYAYFTYQRDKVLTEVAEKRLQAIKEFTELGSGFKIAMRDLAIRGAGNLLGAEQHGFIHSVGFDLYNDMLADAVKELKGERQEAAPDATIDLGIEAYLPDTFIPNPAQKIAMYKKLKFVRSLQAADEVEEELEDRYGDLPEAVRNLLDVTRIKSLAVRFGVASVTRHGSEVVYVFHQGAGRKLNHGLLYGIVVQHKGEYRKKADGTVQLAFRAKDLTDRQLCQQILGFLKSCEQAVEAPQAAEPAVR
ncbi:MAG: transcription-repair coupling factor [Alicyclobacillus sp.]|nr:transcription-repair coupling factor [Alicyclobacillus sp.]